MAQGKKTEAEDLLRKSKADFSDNPDGYRILGDYYYAIGDLDKALEEYKSLNHEHPQDWQVRLSDRPARKVLRADPAPRPQFERSTPGYV